MTLHLFTQLRTIVSVGAAIGLLMVGSFSAIAQDSTPGPATDDGGFTVNGLVDYPGQVTMEDLAAFSAEVIEVSFTTEGTPVDNSFTGTNLFAFLESFGLQIPNEPHDAQLGMVVKLTATDGYITIISIGEIDPKFGGAPILLAWEQNGETLTLPELVVPGDATEGRYIWGVKSIEILLV